MKLGLSRIALVCLTAGCASAGLSSTGWEVGRQWGCDPEEVQRDYADAHGGEAASEAYVPRVGWSACQLLSLTGLPDEVSQVEGGDTYHLYYQAEEDTRIVTLRRGPARMWSVAAVVW